jgi:hypothetical protein
MSGPRGDLAVERHGPFGMNPGTPPRDERHKRSDELTGLAFEQSDFDLNPGPPEFIETAAGDVRSRIAASNDDATDSCSYDGT